MRDYPSRVRSVRRRNVAPGIAPQRWGAEIIRYITQKNVAPQPIPITSIINQTMSMRTLIAGKPGCFTRSANCCIDRNASYRMSRVSYSFTQVANRPLFSARYSQPVEKAGKHRTIRPNHMGLVLLLNSCTIVAIDRDGADLGTATGAPAVPSPATAARHGVAMGTGPAMTERNPRQAGLPEMRRDTPLAEADQPDGGVVPPLRTSIPRC